MVELPIYEIYYKRYRNDFRFGSYLALLKSMTIKHLVTRLYGSSELTDATFQRLNRTRDLIRILIFHGVESDEGCAALEKINHAHKNIPAEEQDYHYILSTFFLEPIRWNNTFGKQKISDEDVSTLIQFWVGVGEGMGLGDMPSNYAAWLLFQKDYEEKYQGYSEEGESLAKKSLQSVVTLSIPFGFRKLSRKILLSTMSKTDRLYLNLPSAPGFLGRCLKYF